MDFPARQIDREATDARNLRVDTLGRAAASPIYKPQSDRDAIVTRIASAERRIRLNQAEIDRTAEKIATLRAQVETLGNANDEWNERLFAARADLAAYDGETATQHAKAMGASLFGNID